MQGDMTYEVIDNFLPEGEFKAIVEAITGSYFPWYTKIEGIAYGNDFSDKYFSHLLYENSRPNSDYFGTLNPILTKIKAKALIRAKANLYTRNTKLVEHGKHVDFNYPHKAFILYLNTNNGFTRMPDGTVVNSVANRGVFFNGNEPHNSTNCTDELFRINISINYF
jgi:hypothetical protein